MPLDWSRLFPPGDFRWHMGLRPGDAPAFFAPTTAHESLLEERRHWLAQAPEEYALLTPGGVPLLAEAKSLAREWGEALADDSLLALGCGWEPDFVLLSLGDHGPIVEGGVVCFPSSWSLREKLGRTLVETHAPVPNLNDGLAARIVTALRKLPRASAWERDNWGLVRTPEMNRHPTLGRRRFDAAARPEEAWLRVEHQILFKLPQTEGILFGIRLTHVALRELHADPLARTALREALVSMSDDIAAYKNLTEIRAPLIDWLSIG